MKELNITWEGVHDDTGFLFSFAKSLSCAVKKSPWPEYADDIIATSGFAFRMWVSDDLCPSATSMWQFCMQKPWVENGGLTCDYVERLWGQDDAEENLRREAIKVIKKSIDNGVPVVSWDIGIPEWGLITGYDDETQTFSTLAINSWQSKSAQMPYDTLGKREIPIMSVLAVTGKSNKSKEAILTDTKRLAITHLLGREWCENAMGLKAYPALIRHFEGEFNPDAVWNMKYFLGTYGELKYYAWKYFEKENEGELARIYKDVHNAWIESFGVVNSDGINSPEGRAKVAELLKSALSGEEKAVEIMKKSF